MTRQQARAILAEPAAWQAVYLIHAQHCSKGADIARCVTCADLDSKARVESWSRDAARQAAA